jgi:hypothetical protein
MAVNPPLLFIFGFGDESDQVTKFRFRTRVTGSTDLGRLLPDEVIRHRLVVTPESFEGPPPDLSRYPVIANMITEAEHSSGLLRNLDKWLSPLPQRVINPPAAVLRTTRDQVAGLLTGIEGLIVPRTVRFRRCEAEAAAQRLVGAGTVILRRPGTHGGDVIGLFDSFDAALEALEGDGEHIATEFVDYRSPDGLYRKFRLFFIGQHRILRHALIGDSWMVHGAARTKFMAERPELIAEEREAFESEEPFSPDVCATFDAVRERMPLDFFGLDFGLTPSGQVVLFEANATMSFMPNLFIEKFEHVRRCHGPAQKALMQLLGVSAA